MGKHGVVSLIMRVLFLHCHTHPKHWLCLSVIQPPLFLAEFLANPDNAKGTKLRCISIISFFCIVIAGAMYCMLLPVSDDKLSRGWTCKSMYRLIALILAWLTTNRCKQTVSSHCAWSHQRSWPGQLVNHQIVQCMS